MLTESERREIIEELKRELERVQIVKVMVATCREGVKLPEYKHFGDAGLDVRSMEDVYLYPGETKIIPTGIVVGIPLGREIQVRPRSGLSVKTPLRISNSPGTIDCGYKDEVGIVITNNSRHLYWDVSGDLMQRTSYVYHRNNFPVYDLEEEQNRDGIYHIKEGDRIAQIVLCKYDILEFEETDIETIRKLSPDRGGGFGKSGIK